MVKKKGNKNYIQKTCSIFQNNGKQCLQGSLFRLNSELIYIQEAKFMVGMFIFFLFVFAFGVFVVFFQCLYMASKAQSTHVAYQRTPVSSTRRWLRRNFHDLQRLQVKPFFIYYMRVTTNIKSLSVPDFCFIMKLLLFITIFSFESPAACHLAAVFWLSQFLSDSFHDILKAFMRLKVHLLLSNLAES